MTATQATEAPASLIRIEPAAAEYRRRVERLDTSRAIQLSRFSYVRPDGPAIVLHSPLCHSVARILHPQFAAVLAALSQPQLLHNIAQANYSLSQTQLTEALELLFIEGFIGYSGPGAVADVDDSRALRQWEFHDLLFHARSRVGRHGNPLGGTFRFRGQIEPLPAVKPPMSGVRFPLVRPDLDQLAIRDMPLTTAIEQRSSVRKYGENPITLQELGEFLYRVARVRRTVKVEDVELTSRPYPNGGASYELELYVIADRCEGLLPGLFHYDPVDHTLEPLSAASRLTEQFLDDAFVFCGRNTRPEALIVITARFQRVSWKYASIAYATTLKNVGALYQTMYLVATAMGLAPCALGSGDSDRFSTLLGEDYYTEGAVGEFMLGKPNRN
jgi:SagB-type dehydrogenase family enzyme